jgi:restriction endonuclease S subunit
LIDNQLRKISFKDLRDFGVKIYHPNEIKRNYVDYGGIIFLRAQNVRPFEIDLESSKVYISDEDAKKLNRNQIKYEDVLITRTGANFGQCAIYLYKEKTIASSHTFIVRTQELNPFFLTVFLNTKYGRKLINKGMYGASQPEIAPFYLYRIPVPNLSNYFYKLIENIYKRSFDLISRSRDFYSHAEQILLSELNLLNWKPRRRLSFVKKYSDTQTASRIDAEYFQPMYEEIENIINNYHRGFDRVCGQFRQNKKPFKRIPYKDYKYIEISCINISDGSMQPLILMGDELPANAKINFSDKDVIVSKVRPYRGAIGIVTGNDYVGSGAFTVLQENGGINKETLFVFLRSKPMLEYSLKFNTGTSYPTITDNDILNFPLPLIVETKQKQIKEKVKEAINAKYISKQFLDIAKRGVEMAIEKNEKTAQEWIDSELKNLNIKL